MSSITPAVPTDAELVVSLEAALDAAKVELAELEPKRDALTARIASLEHTIAIYKGETPPAPRRRQTRRRAASADGTTPARRPRAKKQTA